MRMAQAGSGRGRAEGPGVGGCAEEQGLSLASTWGAVWRAQESEWPRGAAIGRLTSQGPVSPLRREGRGW